MLIDPELHFPIEAAILKLTRTYGHPDDIPLGCLEAEGIDEKTAEACEALLSSREVSPDATEAIQQWMEIIREHSDQSVQRRTSRIP